MEPDKPQAKPTDHLPESLRTHEELAGDEAELCAAFDLDEDGNYTDGWLVLTGGRLGSFRRDGADGRWSVRWHDVAALSDAKVVEGLGVHVLRLLAGDAVAAEYRYTLRHAREAAKLHRRLERRVKGGEEADEPPEQAESDAEGKKLRCDKCGRIVPAWSEVCPACMSKRKVLLRLIDFIGPHRTRLYFGLGLGVAATLLGIAQPFLTKPMIDRGLGGRAGGQPDLPLFFFLVALMAVFVLFSTAVRTVQERVMFRLGTTVAARIRDTVYEHMHKLSLSYFAKKQTGSLVTRVTSDSDRLWSFLAMTCVEVVVSVLTIVAVTAAMLVMNWRLAALVLLPVPLMIALMVLFHKSLHDRFHRWWHRWGQLTAVVADALPGVRVIKAFSQEKREVRRFAVRNREVYDEEMGFISTITLFGPVMIFTTHLSVLLVWIIGGWWVWRDWSAMRQAAAGGGEMGGFMTVGTLMAFMGFLAMFLRPIHMIAHMDQAFNRAATSAQRIFEVLDTPPTIYSRSGARKADSLRGAIELRNVSFSYDGVRKVLKDVNLAIAAGEMVGLAGPSGGGKTTLVNLVCRFYDPLSGQVLIDGVDIRDYDVADLRRRIGVVLQEPFLFHGTVADNIAYGHERATIEQIIAAAKAANAHDFIVGFPDGYDTMVGERGQTLSGGERQRISIARAVLCNPRILILDEATSSVDTETEKLIQEAIDRLVADRTTIAIAHRLSTLRRADRLVILEKGLVVETGTHDELAARDGGLYAKLLNMQREAQSLIAIKG